MVAQQGNFVRVGSGWGRGVTCVLRTVLDELRAEHDHRWDWVEGRGE